jgi:hypothetical protein
VSVPRSAFPHQAPFFFFLTRKEQQRHLSPYNT